MHNAAGSRRSTLILNVNPAPPLHQTNDSQHTDPHSCDLNQSFILNSHQTSDILIMTFANVGLFFSFLYLSAVIQMSFPVHTLPRHPLYKIYFPKHPLSEHIPNFPRVPLPEVQRFGRSCLSCLLRGTPCRRAVTLMPESCRQTRHSAE